jgi:nucleotide-binding universal stress UspA family protein
VIGALKRGLAFRIVVGGNATRIVEAAPGDVLTVRAPPSGDT